EVHAEEGKRRIRNRVDESLDELARLRSKRVVVPAEGHDAEVARPRATERGDAIRLQACAGDDEPRGDRARVGVEAAVLDSPHGRAQTDRAARCTNLARICRGYGRVVDDPALGDVEGVDAAHVRLELGALVRVDPTDREAVLAAALEQLLEAGAFALVCGDDELAADPVRDPVPVGELDQRTPAIAAEARLQAAGCVVQTGVED